MLNLYFGVSFRYIVFFCLCIKMYYMCIHEASTQTSEFSLKIFKLVLAHKILVISLRGIIRWYVIKKLLKQLRKCFEKIDKVRKENVLCDSIYRPSPHFSSKEVSFVNYRNSREENATTLNSLNQLISRRSNCNCRRFDLRALTSLLFVRNFYSTLALWWVTKSKWRSIKKHRETWKNWIQIHAKTRVQHFCLEMLTKVLKSTSTAAFTETDFKEA